MLNILLTITGISLFVYLGYSVLVQLVLSLAARWPTKVAAEASAGKSFLLLIPAYREDKVIEKTVQCALAQQYASGAFSVLVIADSLQTTTLDQLRKYPIEIVRYASPDRTKTRAIQRALAQIAPQAYDVAVVVDADNQLAPDFLSKLVKAFARGARAVQGKRMAANLDAPVAILDAAAEAINHTIYCKGASRLGISPRLMGSGMAFELELFRELMNDCEAIGGFDKELEIELSQRQIAIEYLEDAVVYDEKVRSQAVFGRQRRRWIGAQFFYLGQYWFSAVSGLFQGSNYEFVFKVSLLSFPPRLILPVLLGTSTAIYFILSGWRVFSLAFGGLLLLHLFTLCLALPKTFLTKKFALACWRVVPLTLQTLRIMAHLRGSNTSFIHTPHGE